VKDVSDNAQRNQERHSANNKIGLSLTRIVCETAVAYSDLSTAQQGSRSGMGLHLAAALSDAAGLTIENPGPAAGMVVFAFLKILGHFKRLLYVFEGKVDPGNREIGAGRRPYPQRDIAAANEASQSRKNVFV